MAQQGGEQGKPLVQKAAEDSKAKASKMQDKLLKDTTEENLVRRFFGLDLQEDIVGGKSCVILRADC